MSSITISKPATITPPAEAWVREYAVERAEGTSALRGLLIGAALSLPLWALLAVGTSTLLSKLP